MTSKEYAETNKIKFDFIANWYKKDSFGNKSTLSWPGLSIQYNSGEFVYANGNVTNFPYILSFELLLFYYFLLYYYS